MSDLLTSDVPLAPTSSTTTTILPDWYTNYAQQILANQQAVATTPYSTYQGPRVADFSPDQQAGFSAARAAAPAYQPGLAAATQTVNDTAGITPSAGAQGYLAAAGQTAPGVVGGYLNPYMSNVTDQIATLGNRNLTENLLPAIGDQFVGAGGYGGSRQAEAIGKAVRNTQDDISAQQGAALSAGYNSSVGAAQTDLARQGALASTAGNLGVADVNAGLASGAAQGALAGQTQALGLTGAGALQTIGGQQQGNTQQNLDTGYADFLRQQGYNQTQINAMTSTLAAVGASGAVPKTTTSQGYGPAPAGTTTTPTTAQTIASLLGSALLS